MRNSFLYLPLFLVGIFTSFRQRPPYGLPVESPENILKDQKNFTRYWYNELELWKNFHALDTLEKPISKETFLKQVATGNYLPLRLTSDTPTYYKLYKIADSANSLIPLWLKDIGNNEYNNYQWENKAIPAINYKDLDGKSYNPHTIKNKILVLDFWFVHCTTCVAEMPELNKLVDAYRDRKDILFMAIAFDKEEDLRVFLKKRAFDYAVISDTTSYLQKAFGIKRFPTAVVINKESKVVKILNSYSDTHKMLASVLKEEALQ